MSESNVTLYSYYRSSCSYRVRIALNIKGIEYDLVPVHLVKDGGEQNDAEFLSKNPMGQVPYFVHGDFSLSQSMAIIQYINGTWKKPAIFSESRSERAKQVKLAEIINSSIQPIQNLSVLQKLKSDFNATKQQTDAWCKYWIEKGFAALERELEHTAGHFSFGDRISVADIYLIPQVYNANRFGVDMEMFPTIERINTKCLDENAFIAAHPDNQPDAPHED